MSVASGGLSQLACPCCFAVFSWSKPSVLPAPYTIEVASAVSGTELRPISRGLSRVMVQTPSDSGDNDAVLRASEPRQMPSCGHVVCAACVVNAFLDAMEEASFDEVSGRCSFNKPQRLTESQFAHFAALTDEKVTSIKCPVLTCSANSPLTSGSIKDIPPLLDAGRRATTTRLTWDLQRCEPTPIEWTAPVVDDSAERAAANLLACTDCIAHLRGGCVRKDNEVCKYRHPDAAVANKGTICREWLKTSQCRRDCPFLHPSPGLISRTDCLSSTHPRLFCNGRRFGQPCPFRHDDPLGRFKEKPPICPLWADYACNDYHCAFLHPYLRPPPSHASTRARNKKKGNVGIFWDMTTCRVPEEGWPYGVAMAFDRMLRRGGYFTTGPGWALQFKAYGNGISPEMRAQLTAARADVVDSLPDPDDATTLKSSNVGVSVALDQDLMEFVRKWKTSAVGCIMIASSSQRLIHSVQRLTHKDVHVVLVVPDLVTANKELVSSASEVLPWPDVLVLSHNMPPVEDMKRAGKDKFKKSFAPDPDGAPACPNFKPALQLGCPSGDACVYFHEKRPCRTLLMAIADCPFGNDCLFRHVPLPTDDGKAAYREQASKIRGTPQDGSGVVWGRKGVRKLYSVPKHDGMKHGAPSDVIKFAAPPGYWTCCMCMFKFNPPLVVAGVSSVERKEDPLSLADGPIVDPTDQPCAHCGATFASAAVFPGRPKQEKATMKGCWFCFICCFAGNTIGKDKSCQVCASSGGERAKGLSRLWICLECSYLNDDVCLNCDVCKSDKPPSWNVKYAETE